jgi:hypothetical protein
MTGENASSMDRNGPEGVEGVAKAPFDESPGVS